MSLTYYTFDPCLRAGFPCGACPPFSNNPPCRYSSHQLPPCSRCPGGGCSQCPAPVPPVPGPSPPPLPALPWIPPCPPCEKPRHPPPPSKDECPTVAIPGCRPPRCRPCPVYCCPQEVCLPKRCSYPGVPICGGNCGPVMPVW